MSLSACNVMDSFNRMLSARPSKRVAEHSFLLAAARQRDLSETVRMTMGTRQQLPDSARLSWAEACRIAEAAASACNHAPFRDHSACAVLAIGSKCAISTAWSKVAHLHLHSGKLRCRRRLEVHATE